MSELALSGLVAGLGGPDWCGGVEHGPKTARNRAHAAHQFFFAPTAECCESRVAVPSTERESRPVEENVAIPPKWLTHQVAVSPCVPLQAHLDVGQPRLGDEQVGPHACEESLPCGEDVALGALDVHLNDNRLVCVPMMPQPRQDWRRAQHVIQGADRHQLALLAAAPGAGGGSGGGCAFGHREGRAVEMPVALVADLTRREGACAAGAKSHSLENCHARGDRWRVKVKVKVNVQVRVRMCEKVIFITRKASVRPIA